MLLEKFLSKKRMDLAVRLIPDCYKKGRILDIGCGKHPFLLININFNEKYGIDNKIEDKILCDSSGKEKIIIKNCDIETEGLRFFRDSFFDVVTMLAVFEHLSPEKTVDVVKEIKRILKPGGLFMMTTPAAWTDPIIKVLAKLRLIDHELAQEHKAIYNVKKINSILNEAGFLKNDIKDGGFEFFMNIWLVAIKKEAGD